MTAASSGHCNTSAGFSDGVIPSRVHPGLPLSEQWSFSDDTHAITDFFASIG